MASEYPEPTIKFERSPLARTNGPAASALYSAPPVPTSERSTRQFDEEAAKRIQLKLQQKLGGDQISERRGPGNRRVAYVESWKIIELANEVFGYNGWSCSILSLHQDYEKERNGAWDIACSAVVRVQLRDGTSHEDIGCSQACGIRDKAKAIEQARKAAVSDARKRALRLFGELLGNSAYDSANVQLARSERLKGIKRVRDGIQEGGFGPQSENVHRTPSDQDSVTKPYITAVERRRVETHDQPTTAMQNHPSTTLPSKRGPVSTSCNVPSSTGVSETQTHQNRAVGVAGRGPGKRPLPQTERSNSVSGRNPANYQANKSQILRSMNGDLRNAGTSKSGTDYRQDSTYPPGHAEVTTSEPRSRATETQIKTTHDQSLATPRGQSAPEVLEVFEDVPDYTMSQVDSLFNQISA